MVDAKADAEIDEPGPQPPEPGQMAPGSGGGRPPRRVPIRPIIEWALVILVALLVAITVRTFVIGTYYIPSCSMSPTLHIGDRIVVDKLSYHLHPVHRGDIVVFSRPPALTDDSIPDLVKRVIGLPGETISSGPDGEVLIDGKPIAQPWLTASARAEPGIAIRKQKIPAGEYFVMGDNRGASEDSRYFGPIEGSSIVGHAILRFWPLSRIGTVSVKAGPSPGC
ncbi:MAG TPA: signal peptidase I [Acidimicrobiales bacterium]|nr:signal peptidase I [Acidimicrobiales bacterium]